MILKRPSEAELNVHRRDDYYNSSEYYDDRDYDWSRSQRRRIEYRDQPEPEPIQVTKAYSLNVVILSLIIN